MRHESRRVPQLPVVCLVLPVLGNVQMVNVTFIRKRGRLSIAFGLYHDQKWGLRIQPYWDRGQLWLKNLSGRQT